MGEGGGHCLFQKCNAIFETLCTYKTLTQNYYTKLLCKNAYAKLMQKLLCKKNLQGVGGGGLSVKFA